MSQSFIVTNKGLALLAKLAAGEVLEIAGVQTGSGTVDSSLLKEQTRVATPMQDISIQNISYTSDSECRLILSLNNAGVSTGYTVNQIGIFANDPDEGKILYCIYQDDSGAKHNIPSETIVPGYNAEWECYLKFEQATTVNVSVDPANTVSHNVMEKYVAEITSKSIKDIPPQLIKAKLDEADIITTTGTGAAYKATVPGITELKAGVSFMMIPHTASTSTQVTLDVNGLGSKPLRQPLTTNTGATTTASVDTWLTEGKPVRIRYDGTMWEIDIPRPSATTLYGKTAIVNGGTGADNPADALLNLGAQKAPTYANGWSIAEICALEGIFYIDAEDDGNPDGSTIIGIADGSTAVAMSAAGMVYWPNEDLTEWELQSGNSGFVKIWENASPSSDFAGQAIVITELDKYKNIMIETELVSLIFSIDQSKNNGHRVISAYAVYNNTNDQRHSRLFQIGESNGEYTVIEFNDCITHFTSSSKTTNGTLKPFAIYGIKGV